MGLTKLAWVFAAVFILAGVLGFIPGITTNGMLLGIFQVDMLHNLIHLISGIAAAVAASMSARAASMYFKGFGIIYAIVTVIGFVQMDTVLGLIMVNSADNLLHLVFTVALLGIGFGMKPHTEMMAYTPPPPPMPQQTMPR